MGFNKRYLNKENITKIYSQGLSQLIQYINNSDCIIIEDDFAEGVSDIIFNYENLSLMESEINNLLEEYGN